MTLTCTLCREMVEGPDPAAMAAAASGGEPSKAMDLTVAFSDPVMRYHAAAMMFAQHIQARHPVVMPHLMQFSQDFSIYLAAKLATSGDPHFSTAQEQARRQFYWLLAGDLAFNSAAADPTGLIITG